MTPRPLARNSNRPAAGRKRNDAAPRDPSPVVEAWRSRRSGLDHRVLRVAGGFRPEVFWAEAFRPVRAVGVSSLDRLARSPVEALALSRADAIARSEAFDAAFLRDVRAKRNAPRRR